ncbi:MAG: NfeD family protein [Acidimicrobiia bacterium]|nr:NfeD family protein [Acidimicrobiia bacterium]
MEDEIWRWLWTGFAVVMGIGEIFTAGFFLLPFAIGAAASAVLAWIGVNVLVQWLAFFGVSVLAMFYLRRFINRQDEGDQPRIGANRWVGSTGTVIVAINPIDGTGMVRIDQEEWRAGTATGNEIAEGTVVTVTDVRGTRMVVEPTQERGN